ncbi:hypothetical protein MUN77_07190 [Leucobacter allii]|uniref:hypothetical protein n=1 Tax=Leucobacter allii TaxID=2932247 RepID=UPI001FCF97E6|nr:hypothetical protein [Leucobacter allii]UOR03072.1 hypothetical protein MUN77_07190 [Leucobacter allii]
MHGGMLRDAIEEAHALVDRGEQGLALQLLVRILDAAAPAEDPDAACAVAEATGMAVRLLGPVAAPGELAGRLERLDRLVAGQTDDRVREAQADAHLQQVEWIHDVEVDDPVVFVDVLRAAEELVARYADPDAPVGVRTAWAEAKLTEVVLRAWLGRPAEERAVGLETLALALEGEATSRLREIRSDALVRAAALRGGLGDADASEVLWRLAADASIVARSAVARHRAALALLDLARARGDGRAWAEAEAVLEETGWDDAPGAHARCVFAAALLERRDPDDAQRLAPGIWRRLIAAHAHGAPDARATLWSWLAAAADIASAPFVDAEVLAAADAAALDDADDATTPARLRLALRRAELAAQAGDPGTAAELAARAEARFPTALDDPRLAAPAARGMLERALRLSDIGRTPESLAVLDRVIVELGARDAGTEHLEAQAYYWRGRLAREIGDGPAAAAAVDRTVERFADAADPDVRVWAANALFSQWQARDPLPGETDPVERFLGLFAADTDPRILRLEARGRLRRAVDAHERGGTPLAVRLLEELLGRFGDSADEEIADTVRTARDNLRILSPVAESTVPAVGSDAHELRLAIAEADRLLAAGHDDAAIPLLEDVETRARRSGSSDDALIGLVAVDLIAGVHAEAQRWPQLAETAQRALLLPEDADHRAQRIRARAHVRLATAYTRLGDAAAAIGVYEALDAVAAESRDDEIASARQLAAYNRAVLLDEDGRPGAADAYRHALRVHEGFAATPERTLRQVKALRNLAIISTQAGLTADAADAHRRVIELALRAPDSGTAERARASAVDVATLYERTGQLPAAADMQAWIAAAPALGFTRQELGRAAREAKRLRKAARRR